MLVVIPFHFASGKKFTESNLSAVGLHPFIELTKHLTARVDDSRATPVYTYLHVNRLVFIKQNTYYAKTGKIFRVVSN